jgi:hypothetical protein
MFCKLGICRRECNTAAAGRLQESEGLTYRRNPDSPSGDVHWIAVGLLECMLIAIN